MTKKIYALCYWTSPCTTVEEIEEKHFKNRKNDVTID
jgi:hypothetical protein